ncbi:hypothetical protein [Methanospirillum lacunae]|uniref:Glucosyltransferase 3-like C-terminal domain-containing protein n=1 Tax=Methanospirillum lacunae TaxID=668570 RepID=A0A2V2MWT3_9EURY|nr:hypothetical protein [Methanospirillum lacunae]PWR70690.1 hypothetical protein DK846_13855 [Methanospirillum lacunae]
MTKPKILIIHPEGNINTNPNLSGIVEILCDIGYNVDIVSPEMNFFQETPCVGSKLLLYNSSSKRKYFFNKKIPIVLKIAQIGRNNNIRKEKINRSIYLIRDFLFKKKVIRKNNIVFILISNYLWDRTKYKIIIGIDRDGIIEASYFSKIFDIPYALISYEIFFLDETSEEFKKPEISACKEIAFAVCQDPLRSSLLVQENQISQPNIVNIPVAGREIRTGKQSHYLHEKLNIPKEKKIALFAGSISKWSMIEELIMTVQKWPDNWVLVLHSRYGINYQDLWEFQYDTESIFISFDSYNELQDLSEMLFSVNLGIALYNPTFESIYTGKNIKYLGLSSGKIATYLQHGIPVLTNQNGIIGEYIREYQAGYTINNVEDIPDILQKINFSGCKERCYKLFKEKLDLNLHIHPLIKKIMET